MRRTKAHEKALATIRDLKARLKRTQADYDALRWYVDPIFGYDPFKSFATASGMSKREYPGFAADPEAAHASLKEAFKDLDLSPASAVEAR